MPCSEPDALLRSLAGLEGEAARNRAESHVHSCASCRSRIEALLEPAEPLSRLVAFLPPASAGGCPELEDLACWHNRDPMDAGRAREIALHVPQCEACSLLVAQLRLEFGGPAEAPAPAPAPADSTVSAAKLAGSSASQAPVIAQVVGVLILAVAAIAFIAPRIGSLHLPLGLPGEAGPPVEPAEAVESPITAQFVYKLKSSPRAFHLPFPRSAGLQLSKDYEFAVDVTAVRPGYVLLVSAWPGDELALSALGDGRADQRPPRLEAGARARFPAAPAWMPLDSTSGRRQLYALYFGDAAEAEALAAEFHRAREAGGSPVAFIRQLEEMAGGKGCSSDGRPCVLRFECEVF